MPQAMHAARRVDVQGFSGHRMHTRGCASQRDIAHKCEVVPGRPHRCCANKKPGTTQVSCTSSRHVSARYYRWRKSGILYLFNLKNEGFLILKYQTIVLDVFCQVKWCPIVD